MNLSKIKIIDLIIDKYSTTSFRVFYQMNLSSIFYKTTIIDAIFNDTKTKLQHLNSILSNPLIDDIYKTELLSLFSFLQKGIRGIERFVYLIKYRKSRIYNSTDLYGDTILDNPRNAITIFQNNTRYVFLLRELAKTITTALTNSPYFFSEPICCKNPYTNMPFTKSALYNIYFAIRFYSSLKIPHLFHHYFLCNFDLYYFLTTSEVMIRESYLKQYILSGDNYNIMNIRLFVLEVFRENHILFLNIHRDFPNNQLLTIMRPYLDIYNASKYTLQNGLAYFYRVVLKYLLIQFMKFNINFGRKRVIIEREPFSHVTKQKIGFNDSAIKYQWPFSQEYGTSHLSCDNPQYKNILREIKTSRVWIKTMNEQSQMNSVGNNILAFDDSSESDENEEETVD